MAGRIGQSAAFEPPLVRGPPCSYPSSTDCCLLCRQRARRPPRSGSFDHRLEVPLAGERTWPKDNFLPFDVLHPSSSLASPHCPVPPSPTGHSTAPTRRWPLQESSRSNYS